MNKNGHIEYREFIAATITKVLFKGLKLDDQNMEIIDVREAEDINMDMFDDDQQMVDMESVNITGKQRQRQC